MFFFRKANDVYIIRLVIFYPVPLMIFGYDPLEFVGNSIKTSEVRSPDNMTKNKKQEQGNQRSKSMQNIKKQGSKRKRGKQNIMVGRQDDEGKQSRTNAYMGVESSNVRPSSSSVDQCTSHASTYVQSSHLILQDVMKDHVQLNEIWRIV